MNEVFGCGIDLEELSRFDRYTRNNDYSLMEDICTERELMNISGDKRARLALSFSCKEAFLKALGVSWTNSNVSWKDIELLFDGAELDSCRVHLQGYAKELLLRNRADIGEISFEFNDEFVLFQVVLLKEGKEELLSNSRMVRI
jgi:phosphopantetheine--protein transferase-like protein